MAEPKEELIDAHAFCVHHNIKISFIHGLHENGMLDIVTVADNIYITPENISNLERFVRLHYELDINMEGMDAVISLLDKVQALQHELMSAKNRLQLYETQR